MKLILVDEPRYRNAQYIWAYMRISHIGNESTEKKKQKR